MIKAAITGNIASGKSQVEKILLSKGYKVADTDKINSFILMTDLSAIKEIKEAFDKDDILDDNNNISREKLGKIVFSVGWKKVKLEEILHKRINERVEKFFEENSSEKIVFVSVPLLFETKQQDKFDKIIFISADEDIRLKRLIERNNYSREYAKIRIKSQEREEEKIKKKRIGLWVFFGMYFFGMYIKKIGGCRRRGGVGGGGGGV
ncbi:MAG: dephospho-CoA kinase, partial [Candidatus Gastranaerophilales bacterium]|nr:dephospho-CoA kinase [Candidatus Gastranaerophilales bacterium]